MLYQVVANQGATHILTWIEGDKRVKPGVQIELKGEEGLWTVLQVYSGIPDATINRGWHVGGL